MIGTTAEAMMGNKKDKKIVYVDAAAPPTAPSPSQPTPRTCTQAPISELQHNSAWRQDMKCFSAYRV